MASFKLSDAFKALEQEKDVLHLEDYSITQTTLEDIFCNFADQQRADDADIISDTTLLASHRADSNLQAAHNPMFDAETVETGVDADYLKIYGAEEDDEMLV
jgi:hypothetical protein